MPSKDRPVPKVAVRVINAADAINAAASSEHEQALAAVEQAKKDLQPCVEEAQRIVNNVDKFCSDYADALRAVETLDVSKLRGRVEEGLRVRLETKRKELLALIADVRDKMRDVPKRVGSVVVSDLELRVFAESRPVVPRDGLYPKEPTLIRFTIEHYRRYPEFAREKLRECEEVMKQVHAYLDRHPAVAGAHTVQPVAPEILEQRAASRPSQPESYEGFTPIKTAL